MTEQVPSEDRDIVERLRSRGWEDRQHRKLREEAAGQIEQLRRRVAKLEAGLRYVKETDDQARETLKTHFDMDPSPDALEFNRKISEALAP